ncbi:hypothetical protein F511_07670 [Dorcoceras hygrometricum]|uniref:Uncharacterized protein n=1 Tax=Dorcoceras hygrometricum TaxID=472368 RepID=A0A2Z7CMS7_9LAMI|nr:hypothetical protein F511_07670 [Dorcoceras hygrometricum]
MDVGVIDWKNVDSRFERDEMYELINAPKWIDFLTSEDPVDDEAWFCRPGCNHARTAEDFSNCKERTPTSNFKLQRSARVSEILPFSEEKTRDTKLKKRGTNRTSVLLKNTNNDKILEDGENQNPNLSTPPNHHAKLRKEAVKSSTEKKSRDDTAMRKANQVPKLKSSLSARNLFSGGGDFLNKVADFCNELKKLATKVRESKDSRDIDSGDLNDKEKEKKPLLELSRGDVKLMEIEMSKEKQPKIRRKDDAENTPISIDVKRVKDGVQNIRTSPPTPQCFSANRGTLKAETIPMTFRSKPLGRGILQEVKQINKESNVVDNEKINFEGEISVGSTEKEARTLNAFWFLKPCALSS